MMIERIKEGLLLVVALLGVASLSVFVFMVVGIGFLAELIVAIRYPLAAVACVWLIARVIGG